MNQEQDDKLQQAIDQIAQNTTGSNLDMADSTAQSNPIVPQRSMAPDKKDSSNDEAVAAAMASVLPHPDSFPAPTPTPPPIFPSPSATPSTTTSPFASASPTPANISDFGDMGKVKEQALRELIPLLPNMQIEPDQKFKIYRDMIETLHDNSVAMPALEAAKQITDESARAEALLYLVNLIDDLSGK